MYIQCLHFSNHMYYLHRVSSIEILRPHLCVQQRHVHVAVCYLSDTRRDYSPLVEVVAQQQLPVHYQMATKQWLIILQSWRIYIVKI